ncbi:MAG: DotU family type IV/VI secretion system protein [Bacteroidetes bacterium]|nr:hypothetical protein AWN76_001425 [Rhodothermaceae bacterium RA]RMH59057.1 MAG: DotU family type IV/VI secretion system protein [Bacteroidota bacterium]
MAPSQAPAPSTPLFDAQHDERLAEVFAPALALIVHLRGVADYGDPEALRTRVRELLDRAEREAQRLGIPADDIAHARFALVAFLDETILSSDWIYRDQWIARPLQLELYDRYDAGEAFFDRLETFLREPVRYGEVLEIYYLCMALGFKGQYQLHDQARLRLLIEEARQALQKLPGFADVPLAPHGKPRGQVASRVRRTFPPWLLVGGAVVLGLLVYVVLHLIMGSASGDVLEQIRTVQQAQGLRP